MKKNLRIIFKYIFSFYKQEYGKYTILTKFFFPFLANKQNSIHRTKLLNKFYMDLDVSEYVQANLFVFRVFEPETINFCLKAMKPGDIIFDIGANIGFHSLVFYTSILPDGKLFAFEPEEINYNKLKNNFEINNFHKNFSLIKKAASNTNENLKLYLATDNNLGTHSTVLNDKKDKKFIEIPSVKLDDFIRSEKIEKIDFVKIDVEGAEKFVLDGMDNILLKYKPSLIIEFNQNIMDKLNQSAEELKLFLINNYNYTPYNILPNGDLTVSPIDFKHNCENVVFIHNDKKLELK